MSNASTRRQSDQNVAQVADVQTSVLARMAARFGVDQNKMLNTLKDTCFKSEKEITDAQFMALCVVADQYKLNPFTKEIYAYPDKKNGIVPVVGVDGWIRIINEHPQFDGMTFNDSDTVVESDEHNPCAEWTECVIHRKDRNNPVVVREYFDECYRPPFEGKGNNGSYTVNGPWQSHTRRMLRHKALIQCARIAFGFAGIYDQDEADRIIEVDGEVLNKEPRRKPQAKEPQQIQDAGPVTIDQEPTPAVEVLSPAELNDLSNHCVKYGVDPAEVAAQLKVESLAALPVTDLAKAQMVIEMLAEKE